ncbi:MAG TPA: PEP/pyruvate-binding domain-containing protein [Candidatus Sulfopaludibacter sp.]|nr:PEP/pyruvate-binding domain-containing protein [Candidatus Sulfopaludibacter sp.]
MKTLEQTDRVGRFTMPLGAIRLQDLPRIGGKAAHLGEMVAAGLPVPSGFVITTEACRQFMQSDLGTTDGLVSLAKCDSRDPPALRAAVEKIRAKLGAIPVPDDVTNAIRSALAEASDVAWAVRSSATVEDLPAASFAGQHDSFLNVRGSDAVIAAAKRCWLSLFSERAISYRMRKGIAASRAQMAVIVQRFIPADAAGVMFTANPAGGPADAILIEATFGLGEAVVQGWVTPDRVEVARSGLKIVRRKTGWKGAQIIADENGVREELLPAGKTNAPALDDESAARLAELGLKAEQLFGGPQDIEWAQHDGKVFLLQSRPLTGIPPVKTWEDRQVWSNFNTGEIAPDVMTPITWSFIQSLSQGTAFRSLFRLLGADVRRAPLLGLVAGRLYFNANTAMAALEPFPFLLKGTTDLFQAIGGGPAEAYRQTLAIPPENLPDLGFHWPKYILSWPRIFFDLITHLPRQGETWLNCLKTHIAELVRTDIETMPTPELAHFCVQLLREPFKGLDLFYLATPAAALPVLHKACRDWLREQETAFGHRLFAALGGMPTAEAGLALWRLAALAHTDRDTETALSSENEWPQVCARLQLTEPGRKFLAAWNAFIAEHGHHCRGELELFNARWSETPDYVLGVVRGYLRSIGRSDPLENRRQLAGERERLTEQCRRRLKNPIKRWIFSWSLRRAQKLVVFREEAKSLGVRQLAFARCVLLTLGRQLHKQGILSGCDDIFFLEIAEIEPAATGNASFNWRERVESRRQEYEKNLKLSPPPLVIGRFDPNAPAWPAANADAKRLEGVSVSPGIVTGHARVILRANNHEQILPGEILVAPFTDPAWSPYFITAAGLVVEQGGILSHGSIVAREYGLPTVTNVQSATRVIQTGDLVQVDGDSGCVTLLVRGSAGGSEKNPPREPVN